LSDDSKPIKTTEAFVALVTHSGGRRCVVWVASVTLCDVCLCVRAPNEKNDLNYQH